MLWEDILLDRAVDDDTLVCALAGAFSRRPEDVLIVEDWELLPANTGQPILVDRYPVPGQFPLEVNIYLRDQELEKQVDTRTDGEIMLARICALLGSGCLYSDDTPDVLSEFYMHPSGDIDLVTLDHDALDRDEYIIETSEPSGRRVVIAA